MRISRDLPFWLSVGRVILCCVVEQSRPEGTDICKLVLQGHAARRLQNEGSVPFRRNVY